MNGPGTAAVPAGPTFPIDRHFVPHARAVPEQRVAGPGACPCDRFRRRRSVLGPHPPPSLRPGLGRDKGHTASMCGVQLLDTGTRLSPGRAGASSRCPCGRCGLSRTRNIALGTVCGRISEHFEDEGPSCRGNSPVSAGSHGHWAVLGTPVGTDACPPPEGMRGWQRPVMGGGRCRDLFSGRRWGRRLCRLVGIEDRQRGTMRPRSITAPGAGSGRPPRLDTAPSPRVSHPLADRYLVLGEEFRFSDFFFIF